MTPARQPPVTIIGAGLVGALLAALLAQRRFDVEVFEKRADPRVRGFAGGRSINLSLVERGLAPLRMAGLADAVLAQTVTMRGRMVHALDGSTNLQPYGINEREVDHSVARGALNMLLLDAAERAGARLHFDAALVDADFASGTVTLANGAGERTPHHAQMLLGCDGAGSALRACMAQRADLGQSIEPLGHGYKELGIPAPQPALPLQKPRRAATAARTSSSHQPSPAGDKRGTGAATEWKNQAPARGATITRAFAMEPHALHIWPRGNCMCIALPNAEGNFTVTLFMPMSGPASSFAALPDAAAARTLFEQQFADALALMPTFNADWSGHAVSQLATFRLDRWHLDGRALLLGDAAHAVVPFHGQGMNAGFEDAGELADMLAAAPQDPPGVFATFTARRKPNADAIAAMSLANYVEMRDAVADPHYLLKRELSAALTARMPDHFMSRYRMVSFTAIPYATCLARARAQEALMEAILGDHTHLRDVDLEAAAARVRDELPPLPQEARRSDAAA